MRCGRQLHRHRGPDGPRPGHSVEPITAVGRLPIVAAEVTAASIGRLVPHLTDPQAAPRRRVLGYGLRAVSVPPAMSRLVIPLLRQLPPRDMAAPGWPPLGPIGTGALGRLPFAAAGLPAIGDGGSASGRARPAPVRPRRPPAERPRPPGQTRSPPNA